MLIKAKCTSIPSTSGSRLCQKCNDNGLPRCPKDGDDEDKLVLSLRDQLTLLFSE